MKLRKKQELKIEVLQNINQIKIKILMGLEMVILKEDCPIINKDLVQIIMVKQ